LENVQLEMDEYKKSWELDMGTITLIERIDKDSPGSFGAVWLGKMDDSTVAVKILKEELMELDQKTAEEFGKEAEFLMRARHVNLVRFFGAGKTTHGAPFLVLEYVARGSLKSLIRGSTNTIVKLSVDIKLQLACDVARGMAFIHSLDSMHRDLKPGNVLVTEQFHGKVADFGSMRSLLMQHREGNDSKSISKSTMWSDDGRESTRFAGTRRSGGGPLFTTLSKHLDRGARLRLSSHQPDWARKIIADCFLAVPESRSSFDQILNVLEGMMVGGKEVEADSSY